MEREYKVSSLLLRVRTWVVLAVGIKRRIGGVNSRKLYTDSFLMRVWLNRRVNMYDKFDLENCIIVEETYDDVAEDAETETATVKFIAEMVLKETGEKTAFMETSKFEKAQNSGAWLYLSGEIEEVPTDDEEDGEAEASDDDKSVEEKLASQL